MVGASETVGPVSIVTVVKGAWLAGAGYSYQEDEEYTTLQEPDEDYLTPTGNNIVIQRTRNTPHYKNLMRTTSHQQVII